MHNARLFGSATLFALAVGCGSGPKVSNPDEGVEAGAVDDAGARPGYDAGAQDVPDAALRVEQVVAGERFLCARLAGGKVCCAGDARNLGTRGAASSAVLVEVPRLESGVVTLVASPMHACAIKDDGSVWCWGDETAYALGDGVTTLPEGQVSEGAGPVRAAIPSASPARDVGAGSWSACARLEDGTVWCWGRQDAALAGEGYARIYPMPTMVTPLGAEGRQLSGGWGLRCALLASGQVSCWGSAGGLGDLTAPTVIAGLEGVAQVSVGGNHACALGAGGLVSCFGYGGQGALGNGGDESSASPQPVAGLEQVVQVAAGGTHACARTAGGAVYCWGDNAAGELGVGPATVASSVPLLVEGLPPAIDVSASFETSCARVEGGAVYCWGRIGMLLGGAVEEPGERSPPVDSPQALPDSITCEEPVLF